MSRLIGLKLAHLSCNKKEHISALFYWALYSKPEASLI
ncbi:hypothetical protein VOA_002857 [Vibrio sp. RC586]|nr:hypothetical protein VOA_002857 [Vibrio sp. RC586]